MKVILGICTHNKEQENIAKNLKIPVVIKKSKSDIETFNHLFTETNKLCESWDDVVVLINGCSVKADFQSQVKKIFEDNEQINIIDVVPNNIKKKFKFQTTSTLSGYDFKVSEDIFNRFDIKIMRHFIYNAFGGINEVYVTKNKLTDYVFDMFNLNLKYFDKVTIGKTVCCNRLDRNVTTVNTSIKRRDTYPDMIKTPLDGGQIYKKMDV